MLDASNAGIPIHHVSILSIAAAVTGACVGYYAGRWSLRSTAAADRAAQRIHSGQLNECKLEQTEGNTATSQKTDPYNPLPREGCDPKLCHSIAASPLHVNTHPAEGQRSQFVTSA